MSIVLTTGRSGSTALSRILGRLPACLSLSEALLGLEAFSMKPDGVLSGPAFAQLLAEPTRTGWVLARHDLRVPELWSGNIGRSRIPPLLLSTLGTCGVPDPDAAQEACVEWASRRQAAPVGQHLRDLFSWLSAYAGCSTWIERSGGSLFYAPEVLDMFTDEPVAVLLREPIATVQSMSRHTGFRLIAVRGELRRQLGYDPYARDAPKGADVGSAQPPYDRLLPHRFDPEAFRTVDLPVEWFAMYWIRSVRRALVALEGRAKVFWIEQLSAAPPESGLSPFLQTLSIGALDRAWLATASNALRMTALRKRSPAGRDTARIGRLVRSTLAMALEMTEPEHRPNLEPVWA